MLRRLRSSCLQEHRRKTRTLIDPVELYRGNPLGFFVHGLRELRDPSWHAWRVVLRAAYGFGCANDEDLALFREVAQRGPPKRRVKELWCIVGRRGGKDSIASMIAVHAACYADEGVALRAGERTLVACFATKRDQAGDIIFKYVRAYFERLPEFHRLVEGHLPASASRPITLRNNTDIAVVTNNFRAPRGRPIACAIFDEVCFWLDENSATPDKETYAAVLPGMGTIPNAMLVGISSPYRQSGLAFEKWKNYFGKASDDVLVIQAPTRTFHPTFPQSIIDQALEDDPEAAAAEWLAQWRRDLADFVSREVVEACTIKGRFELPRAVGASHVAFCDPSGGSVDSMTMAIAHRSREGKGILDCLREARAPFVPADVVLEFIPVLKSYGISKVVGDHYGGAWVVEEFKKHGISYETSELNKTQIYAEFLPLLNSIRVELLDGTPEARRCFNQLVSLERRTARGGRDSIDHPAGLHDDVVNAAAGALVLVAGRASVADRWRKMYG